MLLKSFGKFLHLNKKFKIYSRIIKFNKVKLKVVIKMSGKILISQGINTQPSLYAFEAHKSHNDQNVYFHDFSDDGYYYSAKKEYENDFQELADKAVDVIKQRTIIDGGKLLGEAK